MEEKIGQELLTIREVANYLRMGLITVYKLIKENKLQAFKVGKQWRVKKIDLQKFIEQQKQNEKSQLKKINEPNPDEIQKSLFENDTKEKKTEDGKNRGSIKNQD